MPKLAIVATIEVAPARRDQLLPLLMAHRGRCLKDEPGTLQFEVLVPREDDTKVLLYKSIETRQHSMSILTGRTLSACAKRLRESY